MGRPVKPGKPGLVQIAAHPDHIKTVRLGSGSARLVLGCDLVVTASQKAFAEFSGAGRTLCLGFSDHR